MLAPIFSSAVLLLLVIDPFGNVPLVVSTLARVPAARRRRIIVRECIFAYAILMVFMFGGRAFLTLLHLSDESLTIAGGVILFLIALRMVFPRPEGVFGA
ncbi:MAG: MarC family protein, partial [Casimicrobiaceae bacterium]